MYKTFLSTLFTMPSSDIYESSHSEDSYSNSRMNMLTPPIKKSYIRKRIPSPPPILPPPTETTNTTSITTHPDGHLTRVTTTTTTITTHTNISRQNEINRSGQDTRHTITTTTTTTTQIVVIDDIEIIDDDMEASISRIDPPSLQVEEEEEEEEEEDVDVSQIGSVHISHNDDEEDEPLPSPPPCISTPLRAASPLRASSPPRSNSRPSSRAASPLKPSSPRNNTNTTTTTTTTIPSKPPLNKKNKNLFDKLRGRLRSSYQSMPPSTSKPTTCIRELDPIKSEPVSLPSIDDAVRILQRGMIMTVYMRQRLPSMGKSTKSPSPRSKITTSPPSKNDSFTITSRRIFLWGQVFLDENVRAEGNIIKYDPHELNVIDAAGGIIGDSTNRWNRELKTHLHRHALYWTELEEPTTTTTIPKKKQTFSTTSQHKSQQSSTQSNKPTAQTTMAPLSRSISMPISCPKPADVNAARAASPPTATSSSPPMFFDMDLFGSPQREDTSMSPIPSNPSSGASSHPISPKHMAMSIEAFSPNVFEMEADDWVSPPSVSPPQSPSNASQIPIIPTSSPRHSDIKYSPLHKTGTSSPSILSSSPPTLALPSITSGNTIRRILDPGHCLPFTQISDLYLGQKTQTFHLFANLAALPQPQRPANLPTLPAKDLSFSVESISPENALHVSTANKDTRNSFFFAIYRFLMEIQQGVMTLQEDSFKKAELAEMNAMGMDM